MTHHSPQTGITLSGRPAPRYNHRTWIQWLGLAFVGIALLIFTIMPGLEHYVISQEVLPKGSHQYHEEAIRAAASESGFETRRFDNVFELLSSYEGVFLAAQDKLNREYGASGAPEGMGEWDYKLGDGYLKPQLMPLVLASSQGPVSSHPLLFWLLTIGLGALGGLLYILPKFAEDPGIKHDHIYHSALTRGLHFGWRSVFTGLALLGILAYGFSYLNGQWVWPLLSLGMAVLISVLVFYFQRSYRQHPQRSASPDLASGYLGILLGTYLIGFYVLLYWQPQLITPWVIMSNPLAKMLSGGEASQWFLYGTLYTVIVLVMGIRMFAKYQHSRYQQIRTGSVMFFQTSFAFLIPEIMVRFNQPWYDFKNIWPLDYDFFFDWNLNSLISSGHFGLFILVWGIVLILVAVPVITYFFGKRWYCSWVCGCGGLAETLGDPYRQLSDKSLRAWKYERFIVHGVLAFAVLMTAMVLYHYFTGTNQIGPFNSDTVRSWYGFLIGAGFAGVVGTGFYPLMGNRVWCRFGCPLAAYLGLVQRFKSRFRITTNGGQCISCGNCSTYCEMGIDVRWYAQRGQDIVRSSCVGCGVCSAVCPRGVLRLENGPDTGSKRSSQIRLDGVAFGPADWD